MGFAVRSSFLFFREICSLIRSQNPIEFFILFVLFVLESITHLRFREMRNKVLQDLI